MPAPVQILLPNANLSFADLKVWFLCFCAQIVQPQAFTLSAEFQNILKMLMFIFKSWFFSLLPSPFSFKGKLGSV